MYDGMIGKWVVVRSSPSGVWLGKLDKAEGSAVRLSEARRAWSWSGAGSCSGLAVVGPTGGNLSPPVQAVVYEVCEVIAATDAAVAAWSAVKPWTGR